MCNYIIIGLIVYFTSVLILNLWFDWCKKNDWEIYREQVRMGFVSTEDFYNFIKDDNIRLIKFSPITNTIVALNVILLFLFYNGNDNKPTFS